MAKISYNIDKANIDSKGYAPIRANVSFPYKIADKEGIQNTKYKNINTIVGKVKPRYWNKTKPRIAKGHPEDDGYSVEKMNEHLENFQKNAQAYFDDCKLHNTEVTQEIVKNYFKGKKINFNPPKKAFWEAYEEYLKAGEIDLAPNTIRSRKSKKKKLEEFQQDTGYQLTFESINLDFFDKLREYILFTKKYGYNYVPAILRQLKSFMKWSQKRKYHSNTDYTEFSAPEKEGSIIHLTFQELQQLINYKFESPKLSKVRDFYCFGCLIGARYSDLKRLTKDNIAEGKLKFTTEKTNIDIVIPLFPGLPTIIDRYPDQHRLLPKISNQKANKYIKKACELAEINTVTEYKTFVKNTTIKEFRPKWELISTHTARKSFVCLAHSRGVDLKTIMDITGLQDQQTLKRYLDVSIDTKMDHLTKMFENLSPKPDPEPNKKEEAIQAIKDALLKKGVNVDDLDELFILLTDKPT